MRLYIPLHSNLKPTIAISLILGMAALYASPIDDLNLLMHAKKISIYGVTTADKNSTNGIGLFYNTHNLKIKAERSDTFLKTGVMVQTNPFQNPMYLSIGGNYVNHEILGNDLRSNNFDQYAGALALGYYRNNNLYVEVGQDITKLNGSQISGNSPVNGSISKETYAQLGKRFETPMGTIDTQMKGNQIYKTLSRKEESYESSMNYYFNDAIKLGYIHSINQNNIIDGYSIDLGYFSSQYTKDMTQDSYNITLGLKANFTDISKFSTYKPMSRVKKQLSKSQKFDNIVLHKNMNLRK